MALDTAANRYSMLNFGRPPVVPMIIPDGTIDASDRAHFLNLYSGISLSAVSAPTFTGELHNIFLAKNSGTHSYNYSSHFSDATSYSISPSVEAGWTFNTSTGVLVVDTDADGVFGNYTITGTNVSGSANANPFKITVNASSGGSYKPSRAIKSLEYYEEKVKELLAKEKEEITEKLESENERLENAQIQMEEAISDDNQTELINNEFRILLIRVEIQSLMDEMARMSLNNLEITRLAEILQDDDEVLNSLIEKGWL